MTNKHSIASTSTSVVDILGTNFTQTTLQMQSDNEGEVVCTLVRAENTSSKSKNISPTLGNVLYVHGFSDYFFQTELAEQFSIHGYRFYALDLRKCGRSIRSWQTPSNIYDIRDYYEDISAAIDCIRRESVGKLIFVGHSTGGLALSMYLHDNPAVTIDALILNSPFLEFNVGKFVRRIGIPTVALLGKFFPNIKIKKGLSPHYGHSLSIRKYGEWQYDENLKPIAVTDIPASWFRAIYRAQCRLRRGLSICCPILVMRSDKSYKGKEWSKMFTESDAVLDVRHIAKYSRRLGDDITEIEIVNGLHDVFLSSPQVRRDAYKQMFKWLSAH